MYNSAKGRTSHTTLMTQTTVASPNGSAYYEWARYTGKPIRLESSGGFQLVLNLNDVFGVRKSDDGFSIRFVIQKVGLNRVFAIQPEQAMFLSKNCRKVDQ